MSGEARQWGIPTTCTILNRHGKWYASITVNCEVIRETGEGAIGLDFGVYHAIAMSDSTIVDAPKHVLSNDGNSETPSCSSQSAG
jgi:putative transposase